MIGIGLTSYNRPYHLRFCVEQILKHTTEEFKLFVYDQSDSINEAYDCGSEFGNAFNYKWERPFHTHDKSESVMVYQHAEPKGIAYAKNMCLDALKDCESIFLLDDDTFPIADNWTEYFIETGEHHLLYMNERYKCYQKQPKQYTPKVFPVITNLGYYHDSAGCFMYLTKSVIQNVGYFNSEFKGYGMEHSAYSQRIHRAGLTPAPYISLDRTSDYIHSLDLDGSFEEFDVPHKPSLTLAEMNEHIEHNRKVFELECTTGEIYKSFEP
jgi:GT2 family glycosyltransferase